MIADVVRALRCPVCGGALDDAGATLRCPAGHSFDVARQGYVNLDLRARHAGDSAEMVAARATFLAGGAYAPLAAAVAEMAERHAAPSGLLVEIGAGTAYYLAAVLERLPARVGLAIDSSRAAARRAARAHPRAVSVVADAGGPLPLADGCAALALVIFAPRRAAELRRLLGPGGTLLVVTPEPDHLAELRAPLGLLAVDPDKERRLVEGLGRDFGDAAPAVVRYELRLGRDQALAAAAMGPAARHATPAELAARAAALPEAVTATAAFRLAVYAPR